MRKPWIAALAACCVAFAVAAVAAVASGIPAAPAVSRRPGTPPALHTVTGYPARAGYHPVTGAGTVNAASFARELAGLRGR